MKIVYLDQNKWIELARAANRPCQYPDVNSLFGELQQRIRDEQLAVPLTAANIYETQKINDRQRRQDLAFVQAALSRGLVFRGRRKRLEAEVGDVVRAAIGAPSVSRAEHWFVSRIFFEAVAELGDRRLPAISAKVIEAIRNQPTSFLHSYLVDTTDDTRVHSVRKFSEGSDQLRQRIEQRRARHAQESLSMRRRIYSAVMMIDEIDLILCIANQSGATWSSVSEMGPENARRIIDQVPTYYVEREIAVRLEGQSRPIHENDFRDMQSFCAVLPYADHVIAENQFTNLARQAGLDKKYGAVLVNESYLASREPVPLTMRQLAWAATACANARPQCRAFS